MKLRGTPSLPILVSVDSKWIETDCILTECYDLNQLFAVPRNPIGLSSSSDEFTLIVSKAPDRSRSTAISLDFLRMLR